MESLPGLADQASMNDRPRGNWLRCETPTGMRYYGSTAGFEEGAAEANEQLLRHIDDRRREKGLPTRAELWAARVSLAAEQSD